ncbi:hypothetical protein M3I01_013590 [Marinomonas sp. RSW2]|uniref:Uncharacterized protein n=1 Tax=Marinomonas maritima TaxID=2940935 RepID=A0ABT5WJU9_9GAMM|nr:hypothetical protein [Marinomonas maritima]MDE8603931.1 hypothetical protein [Marinomonas maritima]
MATKSRFLSAEINLADTFKTTANETITIPAINTDIKTGAKTAGTMEITGTVFYGMVGSLPRKFITHKDAYSHPKKYVLTDAKNGYRVGYLEATTKKTATPEAARDLLHALFEKYGKERLEHVFQNADLQAGLDPQI